MMNRRSAPRLQPFPNHACIFLAFHQPAAAFAQPMPQGFAFDKLHNDERLAFGLFSP